MITNSSFKPYKIGLAISISFALLIIGIIISLAIGTNMISIPEVLKGLFKPDNSFSASIVKVRLMRTVFCVICGASLGVAGAGMQATTRNPLADPSLLGVNSGASLFVIIAMAFFPANLMLGNVIFALIGALITIALAYFLSSIGGNSSSSLRLIVAGATISIIMQSMIQIIMVPRPMMLDNYRSWLLGGIGLNQWSELIILAPFIIVGLIIVFSMLSSLNALALGDEVATGLGVKTRLVRVLTSFGCCLLCAAITAQCGPIAFIGLMAPHIIRSIIGTNYKYVIPLSAITGAVIVLFADTISRMIASPEEIEISIVTAIIGAPLLIYLAIRTKGQNDL